MTRPTRQYGRLRRHAGARIEKLDGKESVNTGKAVEADKEESIESEGENVFAPKDVDLIAKEEAAKKETEEADAAKAELKLAEEKVAKEEAEAVEAEKALEAEKAKLNDSIANNSSNGKKGKKGNKGK